MELIMDFTENCTSQSYVYEGHIINLRFDHITLPDGKLATREFVEHSGGVCIVALHENKVLLVRQYRYPVGCELLEVPAGKINRGEAHFTCGVRELQEETGAVPKNFEYLGFIFPCVGYSSEKLHIYLATDLEFGITSPEEGEFVENVFVPTSEIDEMILKGKINDGKTLASLSIAKIYLKKEGRLNIWDEK